jgi:hypothetical protein
MNTVLSADQQDCLKKLIIPFHPDAISWRVTNKSKDGKRGCVIPYGYQRAYTDRLNDVFTPAGWTRIYNVTTLSPVTRMKRDKTIQTGKVIVTCAVTIHALGSHSGSGEMWADDDNAMMRAEAQAFRRACSCFGLGRYFYEFAEMWVDLNEYGQPLRFPGLPKWALPPGVVPTTEASAAQAATKQAELQGTMAVKQASSLSATAPVGSSVDPTNRGLPANCRRRALLRGVPQGRLCTQCSGVAKSGSSELDSSAA